jgi:2-oxoisovalerate dehydrogenase E1 component
VQFKAKNLEPEQLLKLYRGMLKPRMIEEKMLKLLRQGKVSKWFAGIGQEAIAVGATMAMQEEEYILPMHRNLGVFTSRDIPLQRLFKQFQGKEGGFTKGRDRSFHFGTQEYNIVGMISHLGPQMGVADGIALACKLKGEALATLVFTGEGGTSEGDFHEALNVASVWDLPVIFLIENNGYGLSTPISEQFRCKQLADRAKGYGMEGRTIDGNNILEVYNTVCEIAEDIRKNPRPVLLECMTFRMRGHEEASGTKYVPKELFDEWEKKDPVDNYRAWLMKEGILSEEQEKSFREKFATEIDEHLKEAFDTPEISADLETELSDVYAPFDFKETKPAAGTTEKRFVDAVSDGLRQSMQRFDNLVIMGQDIAEYGGVFKITEGFVDEFGRERVRNTPICESIIVSSGMGLSIKGMKAVVEMQFADFVSSGFNPIVNYLAKVHYRWNQNADVVIRMPSGAGVGAGPFHSQSNESWFFHTPGLKVVMPATPYDAKGLLAASIEDPNPVIFFEHKALYRSLSEEVPDDYYTLPIGKAAVRSEGEELTIITYGSGVHWATAIAEEVGDNRIGVVDLRTLWPLDFETIKEELAKTGKALILHEDTLTGGIGAELSALISEHCFELLDGPITRVASLDTPVPFAGNLEAQFLPKNRLRVAVDRLLSF